jgi:hypothetical protein
MDFHNAMRAFVYHNAMRNHNAMRAFVYVFQLLSSIAASAAIFEATKISASGSQHNRNVNKRTHCIVVDNAL